METTDFSTTLPLASSPFPPVLSAGGLLELLEREGIPARVVPAERAADLRDELLGRRSGGELGEAFFDECLADLDFAPPADFPGARSILVAAIPRPATLAVFEVDGEDRFLPIPPTYTDYRAIPSSFVRWLGERLARHGHRAAATALPLKLLATRSGLARYGRNNITYIGGLGSYFELVSAWIDLPCEPGGWDEPAALERCARCNACAKSCPTDAIRPDRWLIDVERCLVLHNERPSEVPFPSWISDSAHRTLIGCLECQRICPENLDVRKWVGATERFSSEETDRFRAGTTPEDLDEATVAKLRRLDILRFLPQMPRNLKAALDAAP